MPQDWPADIVSKRVCSIAILLGLSFNGRINPAADRAQDGAGNSAADDAQDHRDKANAGSQRRLACLATAQRRAGRLRGAKEERQDAGSLHRVAVGYP